MHNFVWVLFVLALLLHEPDGEIHPMTDFKNIQATKLIKAGGRLREFNFRSHRSLSEPVCHVDVPDDRGGRYYITFNHKEGKWIWERTSIPAWIQDVIPLIQEAVEALP